MTIRKISIMDIAWNYLAQIMNLTAGVITLPVLFLFLDPEHIKIWIVFITLGSLALLFEFGFQPTLTRNIAYVLSGSKKVLAKGLALEEVPTSEIDRDLLLGLINAGKSIYLRIALFLTLLFVPASTYYLYATIETETFWYSVLLAWGLFSLGLIVNFYFGYMTSMLHGAGEVANASKVTVLTRSTFIVCSVALVLAGYGILSIGIANLAASLLGRFFALYWVRKIGIYSGVFGGLFSTVSSRGETTVNVRRLVSANAYRLGAAQFGSFAIQRGNILIAAALLPDAEATAYSLTVTLTMAIFGISLAAPQAMMPFLGRAAQTQDKQQTELLLGRCLLFAHTTYLVGFAVFIVLALYIANSTTTSVTFLEPMILLIFGLIVLLELNHSVFALFITASNHVPFYKASLISGASILTLSLLSIETYGLWALILVQGAVQLSYNNWKWPMMALQSQQTTLQQVLRSGYEQLDSLWKVRRGD